MKELRVGQIGTGFMGRTHSNAFLQVPHFFKTGFKPVLKCVCSLDKSLQEYADTWGYESIETDWRKVVARDDIDLIDIVVPNNLHHDIVIAAARAKKHVFCEKPITVNYALSCQMAKEAEKQNKMLCIGVCNRYQTSVEMLEKMNREGKFGNIYHVYCSFRAFRNIPGLGGAFTTKEIAGGGVLIDWGVHFLDIVMYCTGDPTVKTVSSESFCRLGKNMEDYAFVNMWAGPPKYDGVYDVEDSITGVIRTDGPVITFQGAWAQNIGENEMYIDFMGDKGGIRLQYGANFVKYGVQDGMLTKTEYQFPSTGMFQNEIDGFIKSVQTGEKLPSHIDVTIKTAKIMEGIYESAKQHREVAL